MEEGRILLFLRKIQHITMCFLSISLSVSCCSLELTYLEYLCVESVTQVSTLEAVAEEAESKDDSFDLSRLSMAVNVEVGYLILMKANCDRVLRDQDANNVVVMPSDTNSESIGQQPLVSSTRYNHMLKDGRWKMITGFAEAACLIFPIFQAYVPLYFHVRAAWLHLNRWWRSGPKAIISLLILQ